MSKNFLWLSLGRNQYRQEGLWFVCLLYDGSTRRLTESGFMWFYGFMEKPGIEPATPGLQGIALIHYTTGASLKNFLWLSLGRNQYRREGLWFVCLLYDGSTRRLTERGFMWFYGFMEKPGIEPATPDLQGKKNFLWLSLGRNQYRREGLWFVCLLYDGSTRRLTERGFMWFYGFMEKPGIEPATPGLQGIALIHYTTGAPLAFFSLFSWPFCCKSYWFYYKILSIICGVLQ